MLDYIFQSLKNTPITSVYNCISEEKCVIVKTKDEKAARIAKEILSRAYDSARDDFITQSEMAQFKTRGKKLLIICHGSLDQEETLPKEFVEKLQRLCQDYI